MSQEVEEFKMEFPDYVKVVRGQMKRGGGFRACHFQWSHQQGCYMAIATGSNTTRKRAHEEANVMALSRGVELRGES